MSTKIDLSTIDFIDIYVDPEWAAKQPARYVEAIKTFESIFGSGKDIEIYSAPGRTEIGGNHTDHQHGEVLAASINRDAIAIVNKTDDGKINLVSGSDSPIQINVNDLTPNDNEKETTAALIRGVLAALADGGFKIGGFEAYVTSDVLVGAGISSSAAFETLIGTIISGLYNDMKIDPVTIAKAGQYAENVFFGKPCGLMDQMACSVGNMVHIDFKFPDNPEVERIDFDFAKTGYSLCITNTRGSHSNLTDEYAAVPSEMRKIAALLGHDVLRPVTLNDIISNISTLREQAGDRAVLRAIHFVNETERAGKEAAALQSGDLWKFLQLVKESGNSSFKYLQNIYTNNDVTSQNVSIALAVSESVLTQEEVSRVHGGGFAGTIQAFVKNTNTASYREVMDSVYGQGACDILKIRKYGGIKVI
ncbi:MAG: galactokinase [Clostridiales bacterium]|nr:galactokinase [Clostridiales bacterium]